MKETKIREIVREKYAKAVTSGGGCCGSGGCCGGAGDNPVTSGLYEQNELTGLPGGLTATSLGCGNPTAMGALYAGETVLDLGSGAGLDVLLSARRVGPQGMAYGLDMTDEMLALAAANKAKAGVENARFLKGHIEDIPLPDEAVDVVISNCVINLSADKDKVFAEIFRTLRPGGRIAVSDIVTTKPLPGGVQRDLEAWAGCVAGALSMTDYEEKLRKAGFTEIKLTVTRRYELDKIPAILMNTELTEADLANLDGALVSAFASAKKPARLLKAGTDYRIRAAGAEDIEIMHELLKAAGLPIDGVEAECAEQYLLAEGPAGILGVIGLERYGAAGLLRSMAVSSKARKAGVAGTLVDAMLASAKETGLADIFLMTETAETFFLRRGFETVPRAEMPEDMLSTSSLGCACPSTCTVMRKTG